MSEYIHTPSDTPVCTPTRTHTHTHTHHSSNFVKMGNVLERFCPHKTLPIIIQDLISIYRKEVLIGRDKTINTAEVNRRLAAITFPNRAVERLYNFVSFVIQLRKNEIADQLQSVQLSAKIVSEISVRAFGATPSFGRLFVVLAFIKLALEKDLHLVQDKSLEYQLCARLEQTGAFESFELLGGVEVLQGRGLLLNYPQICLAILILASAISYCKDNGSEN